MDNSILKSKDNLASKKADMNIRPKVIFSLVIAILISLFLVYLIYSIFFNKNTFLIEKLVTPEITIGNGIDFSANTETFTGDELDQIEQNIIKNELLQSLELHGQVDIATDDIGNANPFEPFFVNLDAGSGDSEILRSLDDIEKPLPRVIKE